MNSKNIKKHLNAKLRDWLESIDDEEVKKVVKANTIVTGGAMVSLLTGEKVHDYDVYFKTKSACVVVANYYIDKWNKEHPDDKQASLVVEEDKTETKKVIKKITVYHSLRKILKKSQLPFLAESKCLLSLKE